MPYDVRTRTSGSAATQGVVDGSVVGSATFATRLEAVYSYRTVGDQRNQSPVSNVASSPDMNLGDLLRERTRATNQLIAEMLPDERRGSPDQFLTTDRGHEFATAKYSRIIDARTWNRHYNDRANSRVEYAASGSFPRDRILPQLDGSTVISSAGPLDPLGGIFGQYGKTGWYPGTSLSPLTRSSISATGARQIASMNPLEKKANLAALVGELLKGDIPSLSSKLVKHASYISELRNKYGSLWQFQQSLARSAKKAGKGVGSDYLAYQFGWAPIISDIGAALQVLSDLYELIYIPKDSRRQTRSPVVSYRVLRKEALNWGPYGLGGLPLAKDPLVLAYSGNPSYAFTVDMPTECTLVGEFDVQSTAKFSMGLQTTRHQNSWFDRGVDLLGLRLDAETIWELTPWTWLLDWFVSIGPVVSNLNNLILSGNLLEYAFSTGRLKYTATYRSLHSGPYDNRGHYFTPSSGLTASETYDAKARVVSNPFGIFADPKMLNASQWSILAALGMSRSR